MKGRQGARASAQSGWTHAAVVDDKPSSIGPAKTGQGKPIAARPPRLQDSAASPSAARSAQDALATAVLTTLPAAVLAVDDSGTIRFANDRAAAILQTLPAQLERSPLSKWVGGMPLVFPQGQASKRQSWDLRLPDGRPVTIGYSVAPVACAQGRLTAIVFQDVSQEKALMDERDRLLRIATIGEALPSLLHELKNPLAAVRASVELMLEEVTDSALQEQLHAVFSEVRRMELGFDGIGAVDRPLRCDRHAAVDFACRQAVRVMESRTKNAGVCFRAQIADMPLLPLDAGVMRALILNFVTNAMHASEPGDAVTLNAWYDPQRRSFELRVVDTGGGMTPEVLARCTDLFFSTKKSGSGIGLALCKRAIEAAGGALVLESVPGVGTAVTVSVPLMNSSERPMVPLQAGGESQCPGRKS